MNQLADLRARLQDAVKSLDPDNDTHWIKSGAPSIGAVEKAAELKNVTRAAVDEAMPDYDRDEARRAAAEGHDIDDPIAMMEKVLVAASHSKYRRNAALMAFLRHWEVDQDAIREHQRRLDVRETVRLKAEAEAKAHQAKIEKRNREAELAAKRNRMGDTDKRIQRRQAR